LKALSHDHLNPLEVRHVLKSLVGIHRLGYPFIVFIAVVAACIGFAVVVAEVHAREEPAPDQPPAFKPLRYDEDYSYLRDTSARTGDPLSLEPIKFIPLNRARSSRGATTSVSLRPWGR
jgi:hypothetical protein